MIVIDVGCATHGGDASLPTLLDTYRPKVLYGFDPAIEADADTFNDWGCQIVLRQTAAWTYDGTIGFVVAGLGGHVDEHANRFPCIDLAQFVLDLPDDSIVLKLDCEMGEYTLLPHLAATGADKHLELLIVEWHCEYCGIGGNGRHREGCRADPDWWWKRRLDTQALMSCELAEWNL